MRDRFKFRKVAAFIPLIAVASGLLALLWIAQQRTSHQNRHNWCIGNGKKLYVAMMAYEEKYGRYPPRVIVGPDGKPWHSWRVILTEFIDPDLYQRYSFDEPWDGPNNSQLLTLMPFIYRCLNDSRQNPYYTSYVYEKSDPGSLISWRITESRHDILWMAPYDGLNEKEAPPKDCGKPTVVDFMYGVSKDDRR